MHVEIQEVSGDDVGLGTAWHVAGLPLVVRGAWPRDDCGDASAAVLAARADWTPAFGGEQFSLGRAFYTDLEEDRTRDYFSRAAASDAVVERVLPGMQSRVRELLSRMTGGVARPRPGWCGPGIHVFPAKEEVARRGGVIHFDTEGLSAHQVATRAQALSLVLMLQPPSRGGGLELWDVTYEGRDEPSVEERARPSAIVEYAAGDAIVFDSYRLHRIRPFAGARDRISISAHAVLVDRGAWEVWF